MKSMDTVNAFIADEGEETTERPANRAIWGLEDLNAGRGPKAVFQRMKAYREHSAALIKLFDQQQELIRMYETERRATADREYTRANKRWTEEEDDALIELATREEAPNLIDLSLTFNRSPGSISSRLTHLVGIQRITEALMGRITGYLDGVPIDGAFVGSVRKH